MPSWRGLLDEVKAAGGAHDIVRRKYLRRLSKKTGRNVILYYSGWLQKAALQQQGVSFSLDDGDKNGFMATIHKLDRSKGLDLLLHTPGGSIAATESLVAYLRSMFGDNIRAIVPQIAMSAGTMVALSCREIIMGKHSSLGPIDPQVGGAVAAHAVIEEFEEAVKAVTADPRTIPIYQAMIAKYSPALVGECKKAIDWSNEMVKQWLVSGMFKNVDKAEELADRVVKELGDHALTKSHSRHISPDQAKALGIKVTALEDEDDLQEAVLSVHHACIQTLTETGALKMVENHRGVAYIQSVGAVVVRG